MATIAIRTKGREDSGLLTKKSKLPVIQMRFGDVSVLDSYDEKGYHTLGKRKSYGLVLNSV